MKVKSIAALLMAGALAITGVPGMPLLQAEVVKADEPTSESLAAPQIEVTKLTTDGKITGTITDEANTATGVKYMLGLYKGSYTATKAPDLVLTKLDKGAFEGALTDIAGSGEISLSKDDVYEVIGVAYIGTGETRPETSSEYSTPVKITVTEADTGIKEPADPSADKTAAEAPTTDTKTNEDGSTTTIETVKNTDESTTRRETTVYENKSTMVVTRVTEKNENYVETSVTKDADGKVIETVESSKVINTDGTGAATVKRVNAAGTNIVNIKTDATGAVESLTVSDTTGSSTEEASYVGNKTGLTLVSISTKEDALIIMPIVEGADQAVYDVTEIGANSIPKVSSVTIPNNIKTIAKDAFADSEVKELNFLGDVKKSMFAKNALKGCGAKKGKGLVINVIDNKSKKQAAKSLKKAGVPKAKVKVVKIEK